MVWYWLLYAYVTLIAFMGLNSSKLVTLQAKRFNLLMLSTVLVLFAGLKGLEVDNDAVNYSAWFDSIPDTGFSADSLKDPGFFLIGSFLQYAGLSITWLFVGYALIMVFFKMKLLLRTKEIALIGLFFYLYFCRFYFVHEMTQIRAGAGIALASLASVCFYRKENAKAALLFFAALSFHLSVILFAPFAVLVLFNYQFKSKGILILGLFLSFIGAPLVSNLMLVLKLDEFERLSPYLNQAYELSSISIFSSYLIVRLVLLIYILFAFWDRLDLFNRQLVYITTAGICAQVLLIHNDVFALRFSEVFSVFDVLFFLIPFSFLKKPMLTAYTLAFFLLGFVFFTSSLKIMGDYIVL